MIPSSRASATTCGALRSVRSSVVPSDAGGVGSRDAGVVEVKRSAAILGSAIFFVFVPLVLAGVIPWWMTRWEFRPPFLNLEFTRWLGVLLILAGVPGLVDSFAQFALKGLGTPAPIAPTQHLVVS